MTQLLERLRSVMRNWDAPAIKRELDTLCSPNAVFRMCAPFGTINGPVAFYDQVLAPLNAAWPDVERRDWIVMTGSDDDGSEWVGCGGHYVGTFTKPFLDIPPTGHLAHMRFHEFCRILDAQIVEVQAIWDIPEVMMQANAWPMAPSLGREWHVPGPATQDGLVQGPWDAGRSQASCDLIVVIQFETIEEIVGRGVGDVIEIGVGPYRNEGFGIILNG